MKNLFLSLTLLLTSITIGCTDASWDQIVTHGKRAEVKCHSGALLTFHGLSTGKVINEKNSDGYFARWKVFHVDGEWRHIDTTKPLSASISGNCTIIYTEHR